MVVMKEIIFYSYGDSNNASTWSNVPYLFAKELTNRGIIVHRIDISPNKYINKIWQLSVRKILNCFYPKHEFSWIRTALFRWFTERKIKKSVDRFRTADYCFFTCFDYYNRYNSIPSLLFSDWTYNILIQSQLGRELYSIEKRFAIQQSEAIHNAKAVVSLFPKSAAIMQKTYPNANIKYLGENVINNLYGKELLVDELVSRKMESNAILFIGQKKYIKGANLLINVLTCLRNKGWDYHLDIIGMSNDDFGHLPDFVHCHGYLHKDIEEENILYYRLMSDAKVLVNPTPVWAGFSSMIEAMYFATPIIVSPYEDFVAIFGHNISFGCYNREFEVSSLMNNLESVINNPSYEFMCQEAHRVTKGFTWKAYVDRLLDVL